MTDLPDGAADQHLAWLARSFGRPDYLPLTANDLEVLADCAELIKRFRGSHLFRQGEPAVAAYLIREGEVDIYRDHSGSPRVVARVGAGSVIGDIAMFGASTYNSSTRAVSHVKAFRFARDILMPRLAEHPSICLRWLVSGLDQLEKTQRRIIHLMHKTVLSQVGGPPGRGGLHPQRHQPLSGLDRHTSRGQPPVCERGDRRIAETRGRQDGVPRDHCHRS